MRNSLPGLNSLGSELMSPPRHQAPAHQRRRESPEVYRRRRRVAALGLLTALVIFGWLLSPSLGGKSSKTKKALRPGTTAQTQRDATTTSASSNPVTIAFVGDSILGNSPTLPPDPNNYLSPVAAALKAPNVFGNLEGVLTDNAGASKCGSNSSNCYAFHNPVAYAQVFRQDGFTVMNAANNHSHDFGSQGVSDETAALGAAGITQSGLPGQIALVKEGRTTIAFVAFAPYSNTNNLLDLTAAKALIAQAKAKAQIVVVYMHAGAEGASATHVTGAEESYVGEDRGNPQAFAHMAIDAGAALVVGSGPHVLRGMEWYHGHLIAYSLGNFVGYQNFGSGGALSLSGILTITLKTDGSFAAARFTSLSLSGINQPFVDSSGASSTLVNQLSSQDFAGQGVSINPDGSISPAAA